MIKKVRWSSIVAGHHLRGMAMLIVLIVIGAFSVMGFAVLSASALHTKAVSSGTHAASAEHLAESGAQLAAYYLQHPSASPVAMPAGYYPGEANVTFGPRVPGTVSIGVTPGGGTNAFDVVSTARVTTACGGLVTRTCNASLVVVRPFAQTTAASATNSIQVPANALITGGLETNAALSCAAGSNVTSYVRYRTLGTVAGTLPSGANRYVLDATPVVSVPAYAQIRDYTKPYVYNGQAGTPQKLSGSTLSNTTLPAAGDLATNPAAIYWTDKTSFGLVGNVTINGTLVLTAGALNVTGGFPNTVTPKAGYPAIVVADHIAAGGTSAVLTANGLVYSGQGLQSGTNLSWITINGAFLSPAAVPIDLTYRGTLTINYDSSRVNLPDFCNSATATPAGIRVVSWTVQ